MPLFILVIIVSMLAFDVVYWRWAHVRLRKLRRARWWRIALGCFVLAQALVLLWWLFARTLPAPLDSVPIVLVAMVYIWHLLILPATILVNGLASLLMILGRAGRGLMRRLRRRQEATQSSEPASPGTGDVAVTRRQLIGTALAAAPPIVCVAAAARGLSQIGAFQVNHLDVPIPGLPPALEGLTIAHVSDVHVGKFTRGPALGQVVEKTNSLKADLVLLTGDLIDRSLSDLPAALDMVRRLDPRGGLFMCEGNHDLFEGAQEFERRVKASGIPLLVNESQSIQVRGHPIQILGLKWGSRRGANVTEQATITFGQRHPDAFPILLAHHPHAFDAAAEAGIPLTLSGHTHGGQLMLNERLGFGPVMFKYWSGLYRKPNASLVVSNGVGNWFPLRIHAPAEILKLTLRRG